MSQTQDFIPQAERPAYQPVDFIETVEESIWYNPLEYDVAVQVHVGAKPAANRAEWESLPAQVKRERQTGIRTYVIPAKAKRVISSDFDLAIQHRRCNHPECPGAKGLYCKNPDHQDGRTIVAGLYPRLVYQGTQRRPVTRPAEIHWSLDDNRARQAAALEESKRKLAEAQNARDAFLIAQADLVSAQQEIAKTEASMASTAKTAEAAAQRDAIIAATGKAEAVPVNNTQSAHADKRASK